MKYTGGFIYPPRPKRQIIPAQVAEYDTGQYIAQVKYDGDACLVFLTEEKFVVYNRHGERLQETKLKGIDWRGLYQGPGQMILCGELMDSKLGEDAKPMSNLFILYDILCYKGDYLVGSTTNMRLQLLDELFFQADMVVNSKGQMRQFDYCKFTQIEGVLKTQTFHTSFVELYEDVKKVPAYEGIILKKADAELGLGFREDNNSDWILKCRKPSKMYRL